MTFKLFSRVTEAFEELCMGTATPDNSLPVILCDDLTVSGGVINTPAIGINLLTGLASGWYDAGEFHSATFQIQTGAGITAGAVADNDTTAIVAADILALNIWYA